MKTKLKNWSKSFGTISNVNIVKRSGGPNATENTNDSLQERPQSETHAD